MPRISGAFRAFACVTLLMSMSACSSSGNDALEHENASTVDAKIIDGKTTKDEIKSAFGDPDDVDYKSKDSEVWKYTFSKSHYDPFAMRAFESTMRGKKKTLTVFFEGNTVQKHLLSSSSFEHSTGHW
ncbi:hypothetical protein [Acetobacter sp.]|uniref:hypothetical protein n=1 Tax=Acetobacter sp. TaxID=440 RepID=UPI0039E76A44